MKKDQQVSVTRHKFSPAPCRSPQFEGDDTQVRHSRERSQREYHHPPKPIRYFVLVTPGFRSKLLNFHAFPIHYVLSSMLIFKFSRDTHPNPPSICCCHQSSGVCHSISSSPSCAMQLTKLIIFSEIYCHPSFTEVIQFSIPLSASGLGDLLIASKLNVHNAMCTNKIQKDTTKG